MNGILSCKSGPDRGITGDDPPFLMKVEDTVNDGKYRRTKMGFEEELSQMLVVKEQPTLGCSHVPYKSGIKTTCHKCGAYPVEQYRPKKEQPAPERGDTKCSK